MQEHMRNLGIIIKEYRIERAWTQEHLAEIAGVSNRTIQRLESGEDVSPDTLKAIAAAFDSSVVELKKAADKSKTTDKRTDLIFRIKTGKEIFDIVGGAHAYRFDHDEPQTEQEASLIGCFLKLLYGWGEDWDDLDLSERVDAAFKFNSEINRLEESGFWVYGSRGPETYNDFDGGSIPMDTANISILRKDKAEKMQINSILEHVSAVLKMKMAKKHAEAKNGSDLNQE